MPLIDEEGGGGNGVDAVARTQATQASTDAAAALAMAQAASATDTTQNADLTALQLGHDTQQALIDATPTQAQVDALQAVQDAEDPYSTFARQTDGSIDWTRESGAAGTVAAPTAVLENYQTPADGSTLEVNTRYSGSTETWTLPTSPADGDWVTIANHSDIVTFPGGLLDRINLTGSVKLSNGDVIPSVTLPARISFRLVYKTADNAWLTTANTGNFVVLNNSDSGMELRPGITYEVSATVADMEFFLPDQQFGSIRVRLANGSSFPITIKQSASETNPAVIRDRNNAVNSELLIGLDNVGKIAEFSGYGAIDRWLQYLDWDLETEQSKILDYIRIYLRSAGTNAGSSVAISIIDADGNAYPDASLVYSANLVQYSGGTTEIITDKAAYNGNIGIGRNKQGYVDFYHVGDNPNGISRIDATPANGASTQSVSIEYEGTNYSDSFDTVADVNYPIQWTTRGGQAASDQAAPFLEATEYTAGSVFSAPEPDNTDLDHNTWFNWRVNDGETIADTDVPNGTEAEFLAVKPKLTRFGIGTSSSGTDDRVIDTAGVMGLDPLNSLSNTDKSEFIHWTVVNQPLTVRLLPAPSFVTTWIDYSGNNIAQPAAANSDFVIPAGVQMWVHRVGNAVSVVFEPSEGGSSEGLQRIELSAGDNTFADATYTIDYSVYQGQQFESELFVIGERTITFAEPVMGVGAARKTRIHRVFINANTADVTVAFPAGTWKAADTSDDMADVIIPLGESRTLELVVGDSANTEYVRVLGSGGEALPDIITGPAVERDVIQANRGSTMAFGDLQFRVPSSGNSSLQMRSPSGVVTISDFTTKWSNQQGGASENSFGFSLGSAWAYFRANGSLNLTLHNSYQDATFVCNGWLYRVEVIVGSGWTNNRFSFSRWRLEGIKGDPGIDGVDAASVDHISLTAGDSSPGTTDTYTLWGDAGEAVNLGTYDVPIPAAAGLTTVDLASYDGSSTSGQTFTLAGGRTWQDVLDEFTFVYTLVGANSLFSHDQTRQFHVDDLATQGRDMAATGYQTHGSNAYHYKLRCPALSSTTVTIDNDGSSMTVGRIRLRGVK